MDKTMKKELKTNRQNAEPLARKGAVSKWQQSVHPCPSVKSVVSSAVSRFSVIADHTDE
jgi:hypothetical protein